MAWEKGVSPAEEDAFIALNSLTGIGVNNFLNLREKFGSASKVFSVSKAGLEGVNGIGPKTAEQISASNPSKIAHNEMKIAERNKVRIITSLSQDYPRNLELFHKPPPVLYIAGEIREEDRIAVGVVGTRSPTPYGRIAAEILARSLASRGLTIVSGFARGVDSIAHRSALEAYGRTIAVLGSGLDRLYPQENRELFKKVILNGAVITQFAFGSEPEKRNFPIRNRIICGLSLGVAVIEAGEKSGALITAYASLDEGRDVFAVPGRIDSSKSAGTNRLIQKGAKLVTCAEDIIEELPPGVQSLLKEGKTYVAGLPSPDEELILGLLKEEEKHVDYLIEKSGLPSGVVLGVLLELELKGVLKQFPGKIFAKLG